MERFMDNHWQTYRELELIADPAAEPLVSHSIIVKQLSRIWRSLTLKRVSQLSYFQQLEHLERCGAIEPRHQSDRRKLWRTLWHQLNQPLFSGHSTASHEPKIRQVADQGGRVWWYAHDPLTGQTIYLESEEDVQIWLEERLYY
jgi:hypothetical protein